MEQNICFPQSLVCKHGLNLQKLVVRTFANKERIKIDHDDPGIYILGRVCDIACILSLGLLSVFL